MDVVTLAGGRSGPVRRRVTLPGPRHHGWVALHARGRLPPVGDQRDRGPQGGAAICLHGPIRENMAARLVTVRSES